MRCRCGKKISEHTSVSAACGFEFSSEDDEGTLFFILVQTGFFNLKTEMLRHRDTPLGRSTSLKI